MNKLPSHSQFLYLTTIGWKTGKLHKIEIWFVEQDNNYYIISERGKGAHWVQNILHNPKVSFCIHDRTIDGHARVIEKGETGLISKVSDLMNNKYGWSNGLIVELYYKKNNKK